MNLQLEGQGFCSLPSSISLPTAKHDHNHFRSIHTPQSHTNMYQSERESSDAASTCPSKPRKECLASSPDIPRTIPTAHLHSLRPSKVLSSSLPVKDKQVTSYSQLKPGETKTVSIKVAVENASIWWPASWGAQPLYTVQTNLL